jgi:tetratricopeptide (TPR) repeat protein
MGDRQELALALLNRGLVALDEGRAEDSRADLEKALALFRDLDQRYFTGLCLIYLAGAGLALNHPDTARKQLAETAAIARTIGNRWLLPAAINSQGEVARFQDDYSRAGEYYDESGALFHEINARGGLARIYHSQAYVALERGDARLANSLFRQGLDLYQQLGIRRGAAECLAGLAGVDAAQGRLMAAARLLGFSQALMASLGMQWSPADQREIERLRVGLQNTLGEELFNLEETAGRSQRMEEVIARYE